MGYWTCNMDYTFRHSGWLFHEIKMWDIGMVIWRCFWIYGCPLLVGIGVSCRSISLQPMVSCQSTPIPSRLSLAIGHCLQFQSLPGSADFPQTWDPKKKQTRGIAIGSSPIPAIEGFAHFSARIGEAGLK